MLKNRKTFKFFMYAIGAYVLIAIFWVLFFDKSNWMKALYYINEHVLTIGLLIIISRLINISYIKKLIYVPVGYKALSIIHDVLYCFKMQGKERIWDMCFVIYLLIILVWLAIILLMANRSCRE